MTAAGRRSYSAATAAWAPDEPQPIPSTAFLDSAQPANQASLTDEQRKTLFPQQKEQSPPPQYRPKQEHKDKKQVASRKDDHEVQEEAALDSDKPGAPFKTLLKGHHAMEQYNIPEEIKDKLAEPYMPRANIAASIEAPFGTQAGGWADKHKDKSVLQQHVAFFDKDGDGRIYPMDTFKGFHELGYALPWCILAVFIIHPAFSLFTAESLWMALWWGISVKNIHRAKHGSDTGVYDTEGRFIPARFEAMFAKFDEGNKGGLTFLEGLKMLHRQRNVLDFPGWIGEFFEQLATYLLIWPKDGVVRKEDWRTVYDGSIFFAVAARERARRKQQGAWVHYVPILPGLFKENRAPEEPKQGSRRHQVKQEGAKA